MKPFVTIQYKKTLFHHDNDSILCNEITVGLDE